MPPPMLWRLHLPHHSLGNNHTAQLAPSERATHHVINASHTSHKPMHHSQAKFTSRSSEQLFHASANAVAPSAPTLLSSKPTHTQQQAHQLAPCERATQSCPQRLSCISQASVQLTDQVHISQLWAGLPCLCQCCGAFISHIVDYQ